MVIYQVVNEQNQSVGEHQSRDNALHSAENFTLWDSDHYYHVEEMELEGAELEPA